MGEKRNVYRVLVGKPDKKRYLFEYLALEGKI
jgi:hypothetical protein